MGEEQVGTAEGAIFRVLNGGWLEPGRPQLRAGDGDKIEVEPSTVARSAEVRTVKRGRGLRLHPSNDGGIRHAPPRPLRSLAFSSRVYSFFLLTRVAHTSLLNVCATAPVVSAKPRGVLSLAGIGDAVATT